jgi:hypothetical protein
MLQPHNASLQKATVIGQHFYSSTPMSGLSMQETKP